MNKIHQQRASANFYYQLGLIETYLMVYSLEFNDLLNDGEQKWKKDTQWYTFLSDSLEKTNE